MAALAVLCVLLISAQGGHAVMMHMDLGYLATRADTVVLGTVTRLDSAWDTHYTAIYTDVTVAVERAVLGTPGAEVTFRVAGGTVGNVGMRTSNDAAFRVGERVIVFLNMTASPGSVVGMEQGKVTVQDNTVTHNGQSMPVDDFMAAILRASR